MTRMCPLSLSCVHHSHDELVGELGNQSCPRKGCLKFAGYITGVGGDRRGPACFSTTMTEAPLLQPKLKPLDRRSRMCVVILLSRFTIA